MDTAHTESFASLTSKVSVYRLVVNSRCGCYRSHLIVMSAYTTTEPECGAEIDHGDEDNNIM